MSTLELTTIEGIGNVPVAFPDGLSASGGTANGVTYLNGSKVLTSGSALTFDGTNVGIGTSSPQAKLEVKIPSDGVGIAFRGHLGYNLFSVEQTAADGFVYVRDGNNNINAKISGYGPTNSYFAAMGGNVGIGTSSPGAKLEVRGYAAGGYTGVFTQTATSLSNGVYTLSVDSSSHNSNVSAAGAFNVAVNGNANAFTINGLGNVGLGTSAPTYRLHLSTDSAAKPTTSTWTVSSDARIKTDVVDATLARCYEIVKSLHLKHYKWDAGLYDDNVTQDKSQLGWIAQDVEKVFPKAVHTNKLDYMQQAEDGIEEYEEQESTVEMVAVEKIKIINSAPILVTTQEEKETLLFDEVIVKDEAGNVVMVDGKPLTHQMPRMIKKTRPVMKPVKTIEDCKAIDSDQIIKALYGAVQLLMAKVETLEAR